MAECQWALTGLGLALLVLLVLPRAQINLAASQLHGLIGSYTDPGHYNVAYSGGTTTINTNTPTDYNAATSQNAPGAWGGGGNVYGTGTISAKCAGQITAAFTWSPGPNNAPAPPAGSVIVTETATAAWSGPGSTGSCGLPNYTSSPNAPNQTGTRYSVQGGSSFSVNCTPTASLSGYTAPGNQVIGGSVYVGYTATATPMTIVLGGATPDANGNPNILVGQGCSPSLSTIPNLFTASNPPTYSWNVSGTTFQSWSQTAPGNSNASSYVPSSWPSQQVVPTWYWNDLQQTLETVSCTATVTPAGQGSPISYTATQKVTVQVPQMQSGVATGYMQVNTSDSGFPGNYALWAGPAVGVTQWDGGILWQAKVQTPQLPVAFGLGSLEIVQLDTPNDSYTTNTNPVQTHTDPLNTPIHNKGLDVSYPYQRHVFAESTNPSASYLDGDAPGMELTGFKVLVAGIPTAVVAASASFNGDYYDYLMYQPPSSGTPVSWVPLGSLHWSVTSNATLPNSKLWSDYVKVHGSDSAGTVNADQPKFKPDNTFPSWTIINIPQPY